MSECFVIAYWQIAIIGIVVAIPCLTYCIQHGHDTFGLAGFILAFIAGLIGTFAFVLCIVPYLPCITVVP